MIELAGISDHLVAGEQFFLDLGWDGCRESFMRLASSIGAPVVTVTLGRRGSFTWCNNDFICQEAFAIEAVDTTGAGDVFHGGYIYGLLQGWDIRDVISFASAIAALKCQHLGGRRGIPPPAEVFSFLEARTGKDFPSR